MATPTTAGERGARHDLRDKAARIELGIVVGLRGGHPFEQAAPMNEQAEQRAHDRVDHQPGLMRQEGEQERALQQPEREIAAQPRADDCAARCPRGAG